MATEIAEVFTTVSVRGINKSKSAIKGYKSYLGVLGGGLKTAALGFTVAAGAAVAAGIKMVQMAGIQEKAEAKLEAVLKATGNAAGFSAEELKNQASALQDVTTYGDESIISMQAVLATFKEVKGDNFKDASEAILDMSTVLGTDLKSAAIQVGKALNDPIKGVSALSKSGVSFTEQQKRQIETLQRSNRMMEAQSVILKELRSEYGGAARREALTFAGQLDQIANIWGDVQEDIGKGLIRGFGGMGVIKEDLKELQKFVNSKEAQEFFKNTGAAVREFAKGVGELIKAYGEAQKFYRQLTEEIYEKGLEKTLVDRTAEDARRIGSFGGTIGKYLSKGGGYIGKGSMFEDVGGLAGRNAAITTKRLKERQIDAIKDSKIVGR